jgi:hypothetical protein
MPSPAIRIKDALGSGTLCNSHIFVLFVLLDLSNFFRTFLIQGLDCCISRVFGQRPHSNTSDRG